MVGGTPSRSKFWWGVPHPRSGVCVCVCVCVWGIPARSGWWGGVPYPRGDPILGSTPARSGWWGVPHPRGYPSQVLMVGGTQGILPPSRPGLGTFHSLGWGTPQPGMGYPSAQTWDGVPPPTRQSSIAITCYAAGGMPLAFTQEDFLVFSSN